MINWLHTFSPQPSLLAWGPIHIYWYGLCVVLGMLAAILIALRLAKAYQLKSDDVFDLSFWLIIGGLVGARLYDILLQAPYYLQHPWQAFKIWQGGLAIHGGIIAGLIIIYLLARQRSASFWKLSALMVPGLALAQAIGRWGNYFNQELFGRPTSLPWGIPIDFSNRPLDFISATYFHPTFLYESLGCLIIFIILFWINRQAMAKQRLNERFFISSVCLYLLLYSILRFSLEFIRLDPAPIWLGLRWPQVMSLMIIIISSAYLIFKKHVQTPAS